MPKQTFLPLIQETLATVHHDAAHLFEQLIECESPEEEQALLETLLFKQGQQASVIDACVQVSHHLKAEAEAAKAYLEAIKSRILQRIDQLERWQAQMDDYILRMTETGILPQKMIGNGSTIRIQENPYSCEVLGPFEALPEEFQSVKVTVSPNKKAIIEAFKAGNEVPGASVYRTKRVVYALGASIDKTSRSSRNSPILKSSLAGENSTIPPEKAKARGKRAAAV